MLNANSDSTDSFGELLKPIDPKRFSESFIQKKLKEQELDTAIFYFIKSLRSVGKKKINSLTLSRTLQIPKNQIENSLMRLNIRGVSIKKI